MHFSLLAITNDDSDTVEGMMEPFDENLEVEPWIMYTKDELIMSGKNIMKRLIDSDFESDKEIADIFAGMSQKEWFKEYYPDYSDDDDREFAKEYIKMRDKNWDYGNRLFTLYKEGKLDEIPDDCYHWLGSRFTEPADITEDGDVIGRYNFDGRWDYWGVGGRWEKELYLLPRAMKRYKGEYDEDGGVDSAFVKDIDWKKTIKIPKEKINYYMRVWKYYIQEEPYPGTEKEFKEEFRYLPSRKYLQDKYHSLTEFVQSHKWCTHAVLKDGEWIDADDDEGLEWVNSFYDRFIAPLNPNDVVTIVDYHC